MKTIVILALFVALVFPCSASFSGDVDKSIVDSTVSEYWIIEKGQIIQVNKEEYLKHKIKAEIREHERAETNRRIMRFWLPLGLGLAGFMKQDWYSITAGSVFIYYSMQYKF